LDPAVGVDTTFEDFQAAVSGATLPEGMPPGSVKIYFEDLKLRAIEEVHRAEKQARRAKDDFLRMLKHAKGLSAEPTLEEVAEACGREPEWEAIAGGDEERRALLEEFIAKQKAKAVERAERKRSRGGDGASSGSEGHGRDHRKKHKKEKRHRRGDSGRSRDRSRERSKAKDEDDGEREEGEV
jgi:hypothetical protein